MACTEAMCRSRLRQYARTRRDFRSRSSSSTPSSNADAMAVAQIAELKMPDLNASDIDAAIKIIAGTARSMGVEVEG